MTKILITGGSGFIGANLVHALLRKGYNDIVVLDNLSPQIHGNKPLETSPLYKSIVGKVTFIHGCVTKLDDWKKALKGVHTVVHYAAETGTGQSMYEIKRYTDVNIGGTALMLDILANDPTYVVKKIVVASSRSIYGEGKYWNAGTQSHVYPSHRSAENLDQGIYEVTEGGNKLDVVATDELSKIHPSSVYGITKQNQEQLVMTVCPTIGIAPVAFRYQNVYGAGQSLTNPYTGILSIFSNLIKNNKSINVFEDGLESRDFVYVDDVVNATIAGIEQDEANGEVFNVGFGAPTNVLSVVNLLMKSFKIQVPVKISGNYRLGDIRHNFADLTKIKDLLGFEPKVNFEVGIEKFCNWVIQQDITDDNKYEDSIREMKEKGLYK